MDGDGKGRIQKEIKVANKRTLNSQLRRWLAKRYCVEYPPMTGRPPRKGDTKRLEAFKTFLWRRMLRIKWINKTTNEDILL